jgi:uncharacterized membrane protein YfcA
MPDLDALSLATLVFLAFGASIIHGTLGFGSGPLLAPALVAVAPNAATAIATLLMAALVLAGYVAMCERGRLAPPARSLAPIWIGALAGATAGTLLAQGIDRANLQALVAAVIVASAASAIARRPVVRLPGPGLGQGAIGAGLGAIAAGTGVVGPLIAVVLAPSIEPAKLRVAITWTFLAVAAAALTSHVIVIGTDSVTSAAVLVGALAPGLLIGVFCGHLASLRLRDEHRGTISLIAALGASLLALAVVVA